MGTRTTCCVLGSSQNGAELHWHSEVRKSSSFSALCACDIRCSCHARAASASSSCDGAWYTGLASSSSPSSLSAPGTRRRLSVPRWRAKAAAPARSRRATDWRSGGAEGGVSYCDSLTAASTDGLGAMSSNASPSDARGRLSNDCVSAAAAALLARRLKCAAIRRRTALSSGPA